MVILEDTRELQCAAEDVVAEWKKSPGTVGIRVILKKDSGRSADDPGLQRILRAAVRHDFPVNILCWGNLDAGTALIDKHPDVRFIIDHLGILQPQIDVVVAPGQLDQGLGAAV